MPKETHFEQFEEHTLLKHYLLEAYIKRWATILLGRGYRRVWYIDAFAGAGRDTTGRPGSPVIAAEIAVRVNAEQFPSGVTAKTGMRVLAIESKHEWFESLKDQM